jgi:hypothetical protein
VGVRIPHPLPFKRSSNELLYSTCSISVFIVWLEVNVFGRTILPELYTCLVVGGYIGWRFLLWILPLGIKIIGVEKESM